MKNAFDGPIRRLDTAGEKKIYELGPSGQNSHLSTTDLNSSMCTIQSSYQSGLLEYQSWYLSCLI